MYKQGDRVRMSRLGVKTFGEHGVGTCQCSCEDWSVLFDDGYRNDLAGKYLISANEKETMNLREKFIVALKGEPEKSFIKAGIIDTSEELTEQGWEVFGTWLLKKHGAEFKKEVVDPILADEEASK